MSRGVEVEPTRERVRATIGLVGGYWRPLAAVARLLEELGELAELPALNPEFAPSSSEDTFRLASELADLWIITTALSDQFLGAVAEPGSPPPSGVDLASSEPRSSVGDRLGPLLVAAGRIARIVNYYDGPKAPRDFDGWGSLSDAVADFHRALYEVAHTHDVDLAEAVSAKLDAIPALDFGRFANDAHDPSTAASRKGRCGRLWGGPEWSSGDFSSNLDPIAADLISFTKAGPWEGLDRYVVCGPPLSSPALFEDWLDKLQAGLVARDPVKEQQVSGSSDGPERHFGFDGLRLCLSGFCSLYDASNPNRSPAGTLALIEVEQPSDAPRAQ